MSQANSTKMEHPYNKEANCTYRIQARRALVSYALMSFAAGVAASFGVCVLVHGLNPIPRDNSHHYVSDSGTLDCNAALPCLNTFLV